MRGVVFILLIVGVIVVMSAAVFLPALFEEGAILSHISGLALDDSENIPDENNNDGIGSQSSSDGDTEGSGGNGGGGGGSGGGGNDGGNNGNGDCYYSQISYSIQNFKSEDLCVKDNNDFCLDKLVSCSLEVQNLDLLYGGDFGIRMFVVRVGEGIENSIMQGYKEIYIEPKSQALFDFEFLIQSYGNDGDANLDLECIYSTEKIPKREYC